MNGKKDKAVSVKKTDFPIRFSCRSCDQPLVFVKKIRGEECGMAVPLFRCSSCSSFYSRIDYVCQRQEDIPVKSIDYHVPREAYAKKRVTDILRRVSEKRWLPNRPMNMLDIGCGAGWSLVVAEQKGIRAHGVEPIKDAAEYATGVLKVDVINSIFKADLFGYEEFDLIIIDQVLEHVPNPAQMLEDAFRLLKRDGVLFLAVPAIDWSRIMVSLSLQLSIRFVRWFENNPLTRHLASIVAIYDNFRYPEGHINYLSAKAVSVLADRCEAEVMEQYHSNRSIARLFPLFKLSTGSFFLRKRPHCAPKLPRSIENCMI
jgi:2-polyprenyl-3-methyl-5-hydroxy-6-metoxy-1,4-benzoquinol methylase